MRNGFWRLPGPMKEKRKTPRPRNREHDNLMKTGKPNILNKVLNSLLPSVGWEKVRMRAQRSWALTPTLSHLRRARGFLMVFLFLSVHGARITPLFAADIHISASLDK